MTRRATRVHEGDGAGAQRCSRVGAVSAQARCHPHRTAGGEHSVSVLAWPPMPATHAAHEPLRLDADMELPAAARPSSISSCA